MSSQEPCNGPCNARARRHQAYRVALRAGAKPRPDQPGSVPVLPVAGDPVWCSRCTGMIRRALAEVDELASLLERWADGHRGAASGERIGRRRTGAPSPSPIADTLDELYTALTTVEDQWRQARGLGARPKRGRVEARLRCIGWLLGQLDNILLHPGSVQFGRATLAWQDRLQKMTRSDPVVRRRGARCPRCDPPGRTLRTRNDGYTECVKCGLWMNEDEYDDLADQQDGEDEQGKAVEAS